MSEKMIGSPRDTCLFEFFAVLFVGRIDDQRSFGGLDQYEIRFFAFDDFFPVDILLVPRDIQSPDFEIARGLFAAGRREKQHTQQENVISNVRHKRIFGVKRLVKYWPDRGSAYSDVCFDLVRVRKVTKRFCFFFIADTIFP